MIRSYLKALRGRLITTVHGSGTCVQGAPAAKLKDQPIPTDWIESGSPQARASCVIKSVDGRISSGEWTCTAGKFHWCYYEDEVIRILGGEAFIEIDGTFRRFGPGDTIFFPLGQTVRWHVPTFVHKVFFLSGPGRVVDFLRTAHVPGLKPAPAPSLLAG
jgi:uncharacterized cupin superfamily protein